MAISRVYIYLNPSGRTKALGVDSASNKNEYQESLKRNLGVSAAGA
jgi:hypothetical protein